MNRRHMLAAAIYSLVPAGRTVTGATALGTFAAGAARAASPGAPALPEDPQAPVGGNPAGDVTIVVFTDYNCPYCKKAEPDLDRVVREDGHIRLVYKDWPILTPASAYGARLALAASYQGQYDRVHHALMAIPGRRQPEEKMREAVQASGVDMARLDADMKAREGDISAVLTRNAAQADALGLQGTPTYLIGPFLASTLDYSGFQQAVAQARRRQKTGKN